MIYISLKNLKLYEEALISFDEAIKIKSDHFDAYNNRGIVFSEIKYYELLKVLRDSDISSEIFLESKKKLSKQLEYASKRGLSIVIICGENEFKDNTVTLKNLKGIKGENQITIPKKDLINEIKRYF